MSVELRKIRMDGGTQSRAAINEATVAEYAEAMANPETVFPPVVVFFDGKDYWLADGFHRVAAWTQLGRTDIPAEIRQGDLRRAILYSLSANSTHGLHRTNEDKRRAVNVLLGDPEWMAWSDREIAKVCGVSHPFVSGLREAVTGNVTSENRAYTTKHGTPATMNTAKIGAVSKPDQEPQPQQNNVVALPSQPAKAEQSKPDQEPADPARKALAKLTPDALMDEVIGLQAENAELRASTKAQKLEIAELKSKLKEATAEDLGAAVGRLQRRLDQANFTRDEAMKTAKREEYKRTQAEKRVAELEGMGIAI